MVSGIQYLTVLRVLYKVEVNEMCDLVSPKQTLRQLDLPCIV